MDQLSTLMLVGMRLTSLQASMLLPLGNCYSNSILEIIRLVAYSRLGCSNSLPESCTSLALLIILIIVWKQIGKQVLYSGR